MEPSGYLDEEGLRDRYLISPRTAQRWRVTGDGPPFVRLGPRRVIYRVADVEHWLAQRTYRHLADEASRSGDGGVQ
jgi:hypothetical protein